LLIKRKLNIQTPCGTSFSIITVKTPFSSSPLISLHRKSVKGVSCTRTNISIGGDYLIDVPAEVRWLSITGLSIIGCYWGRPRLRFAVGLVGLVGLRGTSRVGRGASSSSSSAGASSSSGLTL
jgi:hypothetical protein